MTRTAMEMELGLIGDIKFDHAINLINLCNEIAKKSPYQTTTSVVNQLENLLLLGATDLQDVHTVEQLEKWIEENKYIGTTWYQAQQADKAMKELARQMWESSKRYKVASWIYHKLLHLINKLELYLERFGE